MLEWVPWRLGSAGLSCGVEWCSIGLREHRTEGEGKGREEKGWVGCVMSEARQGQARQKQTRPDKNKSWIARDDKRKGEG